jgi:uncharacterized protein (TIGR00375 family)
MRIISDLHIHSKYSRACSTELNIQNLEKWAKIKGLGLLGTGDFSHPKWQEELKKELKEDGSGILRTGSGFPFVLQNEVSLMYTQGGKGRRIHLVLLAPSFEIVDKITAYLKSKGRVDYDGRPIFNISCIEFAEAMMKISSDIEIIPAHCLLPGTLIHTDKHPKRIEDLKENDLVLTHKGVFRRVLRALSRPYHGKIYRIIPWYFREGLETTPEHPFYAVKSFKRCSWIKGTCKPLCSQKDMCKNKFFKNYQLEWVQAKNLEKSDFLVFPRIKGIAGLNQIQVSDFVNAAELINKFSRTKRLKNNIEINKDFCRLIGYYIAEGYLIRGEAIGFSFNKKEKEYIADVIDLMKSVFGIAPTKIDERKGADIIFFSKALNSFFSRLCYSREEKRAWNKVVPDFMMLLPVEKQTELFRGWWRGDSGYTVSRNLMNQMKIVCIRLGIIPSISRDSAERFNARGKHFIGERKISTNRDLFVFSNLSFFEDKELLKDNCFKKFVNKKNVKHGWIDENNIYLPVRKIEERDYKGPVFNLEVEQDNSYVSEFAAVHNCWTPWFGIFGSKTGFDSIEEAFGNQAKNIHAFETGLSSDPEMNWRLSRLDKYRIVSFSDLHSFWPWRIGREATVFEFEELTYANLIKALRTGEGLAETIEVDPSYGKYHYDGHRLCKVSYSPEESKRYSNICPICRRPLTIGVLNRVEELADRKEGEKPANTKPFKKIIPLHELLALILQSGMATKKVWAKYYEIMKAGKDEFDILLNVPENELLKVVEKEIVDLIMKNRRGEMNIKPGYDGEYGVPIIDGREIKLESDDDESKPIKEPMKSVNDINIGKNQTGLGDYF